jgi:hypothetical protein
MVLIGEIEDVSIQQTDICNMASYDNVDSEVHTHIRLERKNEVLILKPENESSPSISDVHG